MAEAGKTGFAPGPWCFVGNSWQYTTVYDADGERICELDLEDWGVNEGNQSELERRQTETARLIAAAPEMLAALEGIQADAEEMIADIAADIQSGGEHPSEEMNKWTRVIAAIASATTPTE